MNEQTQKIEVEIANLDEEEQKLFVEQYNELENALEVVQSAGCEALTLAADFGQTAERVKQAKGKRFFEWMQALPLNSPVKNNILEFGRKAHITRKKGKQLDNNQLNLILCIDDKVAAEPVQRVKRNRVCKWLRHANLTKHELQRDIKQRPLDTWDAEDAQQALTLLIPIAEAVKELRKIAGRR